MEDLEMDNEGTIIDELPQENDPVDPVVEEKELTDEELAQEIERLKEEAKNQEDPKEKRHLEQQAWWSQKILKERDKAKNLEQENAKTREQMASYENSLMEDIYAKAVDDAYGLDYFENIAKTNPSLADKVAFEKWGKSAKDMILETKRQFAETGDEKAKQDITKEDIRAQVYHEVALEQAQSVFDDLNEEEKKEAQENFADLSEWKILTPAKAKKFAEMAKNYAIRNRVLSGTDKEKVIAGKASTPLGSGSGTQTESIDVEWIRNQLLGSRIPRYQVDLMYPLK